MTIQGTEIPNLITRSQYSKQWCTISFSNLQRHNYENRVKVKVQVQGCVQYGFVKKTRILEANLSETDFFLTLFLKWGTF